MGGPKVLRPRSSDTCQSAWPLCLRGAVRKTIAHEVLEAEYQAKKKVLIPSICAFTYYDYDYYYYYYTSFSPLAHPSATPHVSPDTTTTTTPSTPSTTTTTATTTITTMSWHLIMYNELALDHRQ